MELRNTHSSLNEQSSIVSSSMTTLLQSTKEKKGVRVYFDVEEKRRLEVSSVEPMKLMLRNLTDFQWTT